MRRTLALTGAALALTAALASCGATGSMTPAPTVTPQVTPAVTPDTVARRDDPDYRNDGLGHDLMDGTGKVLEDAGRGLDEAGTRMRDASR